MPEGVLFSDCGKISSVVPVCENVGDRSSAKNYQPVSILSAVSKIFPKLVDNLEKYDLRPCDSYT